MYWPSDWEAAQPDDRNVIPSLMVWIYIPAIESERADLTPSSPLPTRVRGNNFYQHSNRGESRLSSYSDHLELLQFVGIAIPTDWGLSSLLGSYSNKLELLQFAGKLFRPAGAAPANISLQTTTDHFIITTKDFSTTTGNKLLQPTLPPQDT
ncbi:hypothetical protein MJO29_007173 [Puccinia striiformis f. sp. tritici]|nr:hypothetical protein MJO29_007173 [Puccinia striiformis f. sp. tritici]